MKERRHEPFFWHDERLNLPTLPVTGVSWYEAMAYCAWLQQQISVHGQSFAIDGVALDTLLTSGNCQVRLPTEAEWEKAAGWDAAAKRKRVYAWGDEWDETRANVAGQVYLPSAVGVFPAGASPCGALDMTGNVWEWTLTIPIAMIGGTTRKERLHICCGSTPGAVLVGSPASPPASTIIPVTSSTSSGCGSWWAQS